MNPGVLQSMGSQRVRHDLATQQQRQSTEAWHCFLKSLAGSVKLLFRPTIPVLKS